MVYIDPDELRWLPYVKTWLTSQKKNLVHVETYDYILELFTKYVDAGLRFVYKKCSQMINQVDVSKVISLCKLMESLLFQRGGPDFSQDPAKLHPLIAMSFVFCFLWTIGGNIIESQWDSFDTFTRGLFEDNGDIKVTSSYHQTGSAVRSC